MKILSVIVFLSYFFNSAVYSRMQEIESCLRDTSFNGIVVITKGNEVVFEKKQGIPEDLNLSHQFLIGSISKQFTAALILSLVDQKLIDLDFPIGCYLQDIKDLWSKEVLVRQLLNHTSGIEALGKPLNFEPGSQFRYSPTFAYYLLSAIAEKVSGKKYEDLLKQLVGPLNIEVLISRSFEENQQKYPLLIDGFKLTGDFLDKLTCIEEVGEFYDSSWNPGGGLIATAYDLVKWNLALHEGNVLSENNYQLMITPSIQRDHPRYGKIGYGFGIQVDDRNGILEISHSGYIDGFTSTLIYYPHAKLSLVVLENVSRSVSDIKQTFWVHDSLRSLIREIIHSLEI